METYIVPLNPPKPTPKQRVYWVLLFSGLYFVLMFAWKFFWPSPYERREGMYGIALELALVSLFWGTCMAFTLKINPKLKYTLQVNDFSITGFLETPRAVSIMV